MFLEAVLKGINMNNKIFIGAILAAVSFNAQSAKIDQDI